SRYGTVREGCAFGVSLKLGVDHRALPVRRDKEPPPRAFCVGRRQSLPTCVALPPIAAGNQASPHRVGMRMRLFIRDGDPSLRELALVGCARGKSRTGGQMTCKKVRQL